MSSEEGFPDYVPETNDTGVALYGFVLVYTALSFLLIGPLVVWGRQNERAKQAAMQESGAANVPQGNNGLGQEPTRRDPPLQNVQRYIEAGPVQSIRDEGNAEPDRTSYATPMPDFRPNASQVMSNGHIPQHHAPKRGSRIINRLDALANAAYLDVDSDFITSAISGSVRDRSQAASVPSAATTSRLYRRASQESPRMCVWDVGGRRWKSRPPIGRPNMIRHAVEMETLALTQSGNGTQHVPGSGSTLSSVPQQDRMEARQARVGHIAVGIFRNQSRPRRPRSRQGSFDSSIGSGSILPPVDDDITPNDAPDADDPGRMNSFEFVDGEELTVFCGPNALWRPQSIVRGLDGVAALANPECETKRLLWLSTQFTLEAMSGSLFQAILVVIVSQSIGTDSMSAFVLASLLLGFTDELVGAIADAEGALCSHSFGVGNVYLTGQYVQLAICLHLIVFAGVMTFWACCMDSVIDWLVDSSSIAEIALAYTRITIFQHYLQTASRTITVLFPFVGLDNFESRTDFFEGLVTVVLVAAVVESGPDSTLNSVGWIQVTTALGAFVVKLVNAVSKSWPGTFPGSFWEGLMGNLAFRNTVAVKQIIATTLPLMIGTCLEYTEWEVLTVFSAHLGPAEVVCWALIGVIWRILETANEGICEAAATRVGYHLGTGNPVMARTTSYKAVFISVVQSLVTASILYMFGNTFINWLTTDATLQRILSNVMTLLGFGNVVMSYRIVSWSLLGAQGRYRLATFVNLLSRWCITIPIAAVFVYELMLDLNGTLASIIVGSATTCMTISYVLLRTDWQRLCYQMQDLNSIVDVHSEEGSEHEDGEQNELVPVKQIASGASGQTFPSISVESNETSGLESVRHRSR